MTQRLGGLQLAIMRVLWSRGSATVAQVQESLEAERPSAYSTIATVLGRMERKRIVTHRTDGRTFVYEPVLSEDQISTSLVSDLVDKVFGGSPSQLVSNLLESEEVDRDELSRIKGLIVEHEKNCRGSGKSRGNHDD